MEMMVQCNSKNPRGILYHHGVIKLLIEVELQKRHGIWDNFLEASLTVNSAPRTEPKAQVKSMVNKDKQSLYNGNFSSSKASPTPPVSGKKGKKSCKGTSKQVPAYYTTPWSKAITQNMTKL